jgi:hypothetical protein
MSKKKLLNTKAQQKVPEIRSGSKALIKGGRGQVIILQNLITKRKQQFLQHKFKSSIFKIGKNINNLI